MLLLVGESISQVVAEKSLSFSHDQFSLASFVEGIFKVKMGGVLLGNLLNPEQIFFLSTLVIALSIIRANSLKAHYKQGFNKARFLEIHE